MAPNLTTEPLEKAHWQGNQGINKGVLSHAALHNVGVTAAENSDWEGGETFFGAAIAAKPEEPLSWIARGLCRGELGDTTGASRDLAHAGTQFAVQGDQEKPQQLLEASSKTTAHLENQTSEGGNGTGSRILSRAISTFQALAPIALQAFSPILP